MVADGERVIFLLAGIVLATPRPGSATLMIFSGEGCGAVLVIFSGACCGKMLSRGAVLMNFSGVCCGAVSSGVGGERVCGGGVSVSAG